MSSDQAAIVRELIKRRSELSPENQAIVDELSKRFALTGGPAAQTVAPIAQAAASSFMQAAREDIPSGTASEAFGRGALKSFMGHAANLGQVARKTPIVGPALRAISPDPYEEIATAGRPGQYPLPPSSLQQMQEEYFRPKGMMEKIGAFSESAAEYMVTGLGKGTFATLLGKLSPFQRTVARSVYEGVTGAAVGTAQEGDVAKGAAIGALQAGSFLMAKPVEMLMGKVGAKIQLSNIRPRRIDHVDGFKAETLEKLNLKGNLSQSYEQVEKILEQLRRQRNSHFDPSTTMVDIGQVFDKARDLLAKDIEGLKYAGQTGSVIKAFDALRKDVYMATGGKSMVDIAQAENAKEAFGLISAWSYGRIDLEAAAKERAADIIYLQLKEAIENALPAGAAVRELNRQMHEIIPVRNAMLARIPVEERNNLFSLGDITSLLPAMITGDARHLALLAGTKATKWLRAGNWLVRHAEKPAELVRYLSKAVSAGITQK